jgi:hypothetical protein
MSTSFRRAALLAAAVLTSVALTPVASYAQSWSSTDPSADMVQIDDAGTATPAPAQADSDITGTSAKLGFYWLRLRTSYADLSVSDSDSVNPQWRVATADGHTYVVNAFASSVEPDGEWQIVRATGAGVRCPRLEHTIDYTTHTMTAWVPAKCLGYPRWVKVGATGATLHFVPDDTQDSGFRVEYYADDALQAGAVAAHAVLGPRVHRWS